MNLNILTKVAAVVCLVGAFTIYARSGSSKANPQTSPQKSTVMITNLQGNSGGSGVTIETSDKGSKVLTNGHVCEVAVNGGKVIDSDGSEYLVQTMQKSNIHDLCIIQVPGKLNQAAKIADRSPKKFEESTTIGHPHLLPDIISKGHFSSTMTIQVVMGFKDCVEDEITNEEEALMCAFFGQMPIIKTYNAQVTSNLILPGSSGSAVYNSDNELSGLVFAGSEGLSYAFIVPYEYLVSFVYVESKVTSTVAPNYTNNKGKAKKSQREMFQEFKAKCQTSTSETIKNICREVLNDSLVGF
jgi:S1-C subfamily serine protease